VRLALFALFLVKVGHVSAQSGGYGSPCTPVIAPDGIVVVGTVLSTRSVAFHIDSVPVSALQYTVAVSQRWLGVAPDTLTAVIVPPGHCTVSVPREPGSQVILNLRCIGEQGLLIGVGSRAFRAGDHDLSALGAAPP